MKALVTGGAGFIGSNVAEKLESQGVDVTVLDNFKSGDFRNLSDFKGDVIAQDAVETEWGKLPPFEVIFHQQAITDTTVLDQKWMLEQNVEAFRKLLSHCISKKIPLIYASSAGVYGNEPPPQRENGPLKPLNIYGFSKLQMDRLTFQAIKIAKSPIVGLRYFNVFGPHEQYKGKVASMIYQLSEQIRAGKKPRIFEFGEQERDHIYVKDVVSANMCAWISEKSGVVNVGTGKPTSFNRLLEIIKDFFNTKVETEYFKNPYDFYQNHTCADVVSAAKLIGFKAEWSIEKGIRDYLSILYSAKQSGSVKKSAKKSRQKVTS